MGYLLKCQEKKMKEYSDDSHERNCKDVIKLVQEVPDNLRNMMVVECSTQRKEKQVAETSSSVIMFNIQKMINCNEKILNGICVFHKRT